jgi:hypothetical protein
MTVLISELWTLWIFATIVGILFTAFKLPFLAAKTWEEVANYSISIFSFVLVITVLQYIKT